METRPREGRQRAQAGRDLLRPAMLDLQTGLKALYAEQSPEIVLYGSQARGDATEESDIDVILVFSSPVQPGREIRRVSPILSDLNLRYGVLISILPVSRADYVNGSSPFWMNVHREGISLDAI